MGGPNSQALKIGALNTPHQLTAHIGGQISRQAVRNIAADELVGTQLRSVEFAAVELLCDVSCSDCADPLRKIGRQASGIGAGNYNRRECVAHPATEILIDVCR